MYKECKISLPTSQVRTLKIVKALTASKVREHSTYLTAELSALASSGVEEAPGLTRGELLTIGSRVGNMATTVADPGNGLAAARVRGLDVVLGTGRGIVDLLLLAAVGADPLVAELAALLDAENVVGGSVDVEVRDGSVATVAAGEESTRDDSDSSEVVYDELAYIGLVGYQDDDVLGREQATLWLMAPP